jgi:hypothetical protein
MQQEDNHFNHIFWFIAGMVMLVISVDVAVMFIPIPTGGQKYADLLIGGLNTGALMSGIQYLLGGNPLAKKQPDATSVTANDSSNVTVNPKDGEQS